MLVNYIPPICDGLCILGHTSLTVGLALLESVCAWADLRDFRPLSLQPLNLVARPILFAAPEMPSLRCYLQYAGRVLART